MFHIFGEISVSLIEKMMTSIIFGGTKVQSWLQRVLMSKRLMDMILSKERCILIDKPYAHTVDIGADLGGWMRRPQQCDGHLWDMRGYETYFAH